MQEKINELFSKINAKTVLLRNFSYNEDPNFSYFSGLQGSEFPNAFVFLHPKKKPLMLASKFEVKNANARFLRVHGFDKEKRLMKILRKEMQGKRIGLNLSAYPVNSFKSLRKLFKAKRFFDVSKHLEKIREIKTQKEIKKIKNAVRISEECLAHFPDIIRKAKTEKIAALEINHCLFKNGADALAFPTIVASGSNALSIHHAPSNKKTKKGELVLVDFGARAQCYCADLTRMFCIGKPNEKQHGLFETVLEAKKTAEKIIKPKARASEIALEAQAFLKKRGLKLQHSMGHGLGIEVHDFPEGFRVKSKTILKPNMVLTVEPGIYGKFGGIRLEDDIVITEDGFKFLSKPQKDLIRI